MQEKLTGDYKTVYKVRLEYGFSNSQFMCD